MLKTARTFDFNLDVSLLGVGSLMLIVGALLWMQFPRWTRSPAVAEPLCPVGTENTATNEINTVISGESLAELSQHHGASSEQVQELLGQPLCTLPRLSIRSDVLTERAIYQTEDGQQLVVAYEDGGLVGHSLELQEMPQEFMVQRSWKVQPGDTIAGYPVVASLGDLSVQMRGYIYAPETGNVREDVTWVESATTQVSPEGCVVFASPRLPTYLSQLCGVTDPVTGRIKADQPIAQIRGLLHFSLLTLRPQSDQTDAEWQYVAPSPHFLASFLGA